MSGYISIVDWDRFQHYKDRGPLWIKMYTVLMSSDEYLELSFARRGMLQGLLLEYARSGCRLSGDTASLSRKLAGRVTVPDLEALNHAGFIEIVASKSLANGYQPASARAIRGETETEEQESTTPSSALSSTSGSEETARASSAPTAPPRAFVCSFAYETGPCGIEFKTEEALQAHQANVHAQLNGTTPARAQSPREALLLDKREIPF